MAHQVGCPASCATQRRLRPAALPSCSARSRPREIGTTSTSIGSNNNVTETGIKKEDRRAAILEIDIASGQSRVFAGGLRNPVGIAFHPETKVLWTVVNECDELGSDLVRDYLIP